MQVTWPKPHRPRFRSTGENTFFTILSALTMLAWVPILFPGDAGPVEGPLTDATVVEHRESDQMALLSISHPTEEWICYIPRTDFADDWPPVGTVLPLIDDDKGCGLPPQDPGPSTTTYVFAGLGAAILAGWSVYVIFRPVPATPRPKPVPVADGKAKERRRRRKRRLRR